MTRQKIKVKKGKVGIFTALNVPISNKDIFESLLTQKFKEYPQITDVIENLWNDDEFSNEEIIILLIGIGRAQAQTEIKNKTDKAMSDLFKNLKGGQ